MHNPGLFICVNSCTGSVRSACDGSAVDIYRGLCGPVEGEHVHIVMHVCMQYVYFAIAILAHRTMHWSRSLNDCTWFYEILVVPMWTFSISVVNFNSIQFYILLNLVSTYDHSVIYSGVLGQVFTLILQLHLTVKMFPTRQFTLYGTSDPLLGGLK